MRRETGEWTSFTKSDKSNRELPLMESIQEMREVCQLRSPNAQGKMVWVGHWLSRLLVRRFSIYITWLFVKVGISANATTFLGMLLALTGAALCVPHLLWLNGIGFFLLMLDPVFDCVDGEIARWTKKSSLRGFFLDLVSHLVCNALMATISALHLYLWYGQRRYLILAFVAYAAAQYRRGLRVIYDQIIQPQIPADARPRTNVAATDGPVLHNRLVWTRLKWSVARKVSRLTDFVTIRLVTFFSIAVSYAGITGPLIVSAWFFAVFGIIWVAADVLFKFYYMVPPMPHVKKV
jgi:phosphatidylglycerophosphate synthase